VSVSDGCDSLASVSVGNSGISGNRSAKLGNSGISGNRSAKLGNFSVSVSDGCDSLASVSVGNSGILSIEGEHADKNGNESAIKIIFFMIFFTDYSFGMILP
jgi:hypothetical protein